MVRHPKGPRARTRYLLRKPPRRRGMRGLSYLLRNYSIGDKVVIRPDPSVHSGMPHRRYVGKVATVVGFRGRALEVLVSEPQRLLIVHRAHVIPLEQK
ncbi:50S ribosomal protein L21e [archaeon]|nr:50S ribosomal protein L21e [archaeon]